MPNGANKWSTEIPTLQFTPTMGPIHMAKDISANGHGFGDATISQVTDSLLEVFVSEPFMRG